MIGQAYEQFIACTRCGYGAEWDMQAKLYHCRFCGSIYDPYKVVPQTAACSTPGCKNAVQFFTQKRKYCFTCEGLRKRGATMEERDRACAEAAESRTE